MSKTSEGPPRERSRDRLCLHAVGEKDGQQLPCSAWAERTKAPESGGLHLGDSRMVGGARPEGTRALPSQGVNPVQHEGSIDFWKLSACGILAGQIEHRTKIQGY